MVAMHWGTEYNTGVTAKQKEIATYLASLDVDLVIGTHPHVIEPAQYIGDTFVIYSLGNIISAQKTDEQLSGLLMSVTINKVVDTSTDTTTVTVDDPTAQFIYTYSKRASNGGRYDFKLYPYSMLNKNLFPNYLTMYNKLKTRMTSLDPNIKVIGLEGE
jgi:poly-gamma-glutamate synthesis protein (capsule biosynthesis protein)